MTLGTEMYNVESKKLLAKLLAEENISVEFKKTTTAGFDTKSRTLVLPILKEGLSEEIITLFIMHEVGHALFTPTEEWLACLSTHKKSIVNILEDVRIERKIQVRYPGSKSNFIKGYTELNEVRNFFGIQGEDLSELNFLNKLNLYTKIGPSLLLDFNPKEFKYVLESFETETFQDVLDLAKEIEQFLKEKIDQESKESKYKEGAEDQTDFDDSETDSEEEDQEEEIDSEEESEGDYFEDEQDEFDTSTLDSLQENLDSLISDSCKEQEYIDVHVVNSDPFIVSYKEIRKNLAVYYAEYFQGLQFSNEYVLYSKFLTENSKTIQYLINEFNVHKNAKQLRKEKQNKIGNLDIKKIHNYQISDKLFKNIQITEKEKSHGLVLFLDWSGSMGPYFSDTVKQLLNLVVFCRKLSIPFDVYAFSEQYFRRTLSASSVHTGTDFYEKKLGTKISRYNCGLLNLLSSSMRENEFKFMANLLLSMDANNRFSLDIFTGEYKQELLKSWNCFNKINFPSFFELYRTPLDETIILAMDVVPKFKSKYKLDKVQTIFLTDGESSPTIQVCYDKTNFYSDVVDSNKLFWRNKQLIFREPKSKIEHKAEIRKVRMKKSYGEFEVTSTVALFNLLKQKLEDSVISYRIIDPKMLTNGRLDYYFDVNSLLPEISERYKSQLNKEKYICTENTMHTKSFLVKSSSLAIDDTELEINSQETAKKIAKSFSSNITKKMTNRLFLSDFVRSIS